jgi:hypothetical protein
VEIVVFFTTLGGVWGEFERIVALSATIEVLKVLYEIDPKVQLLRASLSFNKQFTREIIVNFAMLHEMQ